VSTLADDMLEKRAIHAPAGEARRACNVVGPLQLCCSRRSSKAHWLVTAVARVTIGVMVGYPPSLRTEGNIARTVQ
jgi:hypothetical protein